jgi:F-type H+-transporting ATPase subunit delta
MSAPPPPAHETVLDEGVLRIARVYAEALLEAAAQAGQAEQILRELEEVRAAIHGVPEADAFLHSPSFGRNTREAILRKAFEGQGSDLLLNFVLVLNHHDRLPLFRGVVQIYRELYDRRFGRVPVRVTSAAPLGDDQVQRLRDGLRTSLQREPVLDFKVDPSLLGGVVVRVNDWMYDSSLRSRLLAVRDELLESSNHAIQSGRDRFSSD